MRRRAVPALGREGALGSQGVPPAWYVLALLTGCRGGDVVLGQAPGSTQEPGGAGGGAGTVEDGWGGTRAGGGAAGGGSAGQPCVEEVSTDLTELLTESVGFGRLVTGGAEGCLYRVTTLADSGPGSLRAGLESEGPLWIVFDVSGTVELASDLRPSSDKTVDGRGREVVLGPYGLLVDGVSNLILESLAFSGDGVVGSDALTVTHAAQGLWIDHSAFSRYPDGLIDVLHGGTDITVSWCHFFDHDKVMLLGAAPGDVEDREIRVTLHHNWFERTKTYHPRLRYGRAHSYNNLFDRWGSFASGASLGGELASEANLFVAGEDEHATVVQLGDDGEPGRLRSVGDRAENGAVIVENEPARVFDPGALYSYEADAADEALRTRLQAETGPR